MYDAQFFYALITAVALAIACAMLSVPVVLRRWAFIGEGISHSGFGGAGTAWVLSLFIPALDQDWVPYVFVIAACLITSVLIGIVSSGKRVKSDTAIGIFLVASLAWGFLGQQVYFDRRHKYPAGFETLLFGQIKAISPQFALGATLICVAVVIVLLALRKEITSYCFDPLMARTSGVRTGLIHFTLMILLALVIIVGVRIAGSVLVTALLVLPGATAMLLSRRLPIVLTISIAIGIFSATIGLFLNAHWHFIPVGPAIVLVMFAQFLVGYVASFARG